MLVDRCGDSPPSFYFLTTQIVFLLLCFTFDGGDKYDRWSGVVC